MSFIKHPSIEQFRNTLTSLKLSSELATQLPSISYTGTVKLHGRYAAVNRTCEPNGKITIDSRERTITTESDNAGFACFVMGNFDPFTQLLNLVAQTYSESTQPTTQIQICGEWCGGNNQGGVALTQVPKMFVVFGIRLIDLTTDGLHIRRVPSHHVKNIVDQISTCEIRTVYQFKTWQIDVNVNFPQRVQTEIIDIVAQVEHQCPVVAQILGILDPDVELIGEGIVWCPTDTTKNVPYEYNSAFTFKTKGTKHSSSKVTSLKQAVAIDPIKIQSIDQFIEYAVSKSRLEQGLVKLQERGLVLSNRNCGEYIKWIVSDIHKEEFDVLLESGLIFKDVQSIIVNKARNYYFQKLSE